MLKAEEGLASRAYEFLWYILGNGRRNIEFCWLSSGLQRGKVRQLMQPAHLALQRAQSLEQLQGRLLTVQ